MRDFKTEPHIVINDDRTISVPKELRKIAVQFDHNIETVIFDCPRYWDGHDLSELKIYINYMRVDAVRGGDVAENIKVDTTDSNLIHFEWTLSRNVTLMKGKIRFLICAVETDSEGNELRHWNSELNEEMHVSEGLEVGDFIHDLHADVITDLLTRMDKILVANSPILDKTLTERGLAADAKATGKAIKQVNDDLDSAKQSLTDSILSEELARKAEVDTQRKRIDNIIALEQGSTTGDAELLDARLNPNGVAFDTTGDAMRTQINQVSSAIDKIIVENIYDPSVQTAETITDGAFMQAGSEKSHGNYFITGPIDVSKFRGKKLYFSELLYGSAVEAARVSSFDSNGEYITYEGLNGPEYTVPANASYIRLTVYKEVRANIDSVNKNFMILTTNVPTTFFQYGYKSLLPEPSYEKIPKLAINIENDVINVTAPSGSGYLHYTLQYFTGSNNAFFDFSTIGFTSERSALPSNERLIFKNGSDFFGPYIVKAMQNADGDMPDSLNFTGASHAYSGNTESRTSATGASFVDCIFVDGREYSEFNGYGDTLDVYWVNYVQATNTKKEDGSGRSVLKENYHLHFDGQTFEIENDITALEDITIFRYYGLQIAQGVSGYSYDVSYVGSHSNIVTTGNNNTNSVDNNCSEIHIMRYDLPVECRFGVHPIGLGSFYCNPSYSAFDTDYGKSYFYMINPDKSCLMVKGQQINFKGYYKFKCYE